MRDERREAALAICDQLEYLLAEGCERGGPLVDHTTDGCLRKHIGDLQRTYPPSNRLPGEGAQLWRKVEALIAPELVGDRAVAWEEYSTAIDNLLTWLRCHYALCELTTGHDPGEWDRRIQFDVPSWTIRMNGISYVLDPDHFKLISRLVTAAKNGYPWVKQAVLARYVHDGRADGKNIPRLLDDKNFPTAFRQLIESTPGRGTWIRLPPPV